MSNNKQNHIGETNKMVSSVELFAIAIYEKFKMEGNGNELNDLFEQAKAMHKEEHSNTWDDSVDNYKKRGENDMRHWSDFDEYYNDKFK